MKKSFLILASCLFFLGTAQAQMSAIELASSQTEAEKFLNNCSFIKEENVSKYIDNGLEIYGKVFTDLSTGNKIAALEFYTQNKEALAGFANFMAAASGVNTAPIDGSAKPLGYLDMSEVSDLLKALQKIVDMSETKATFDYTISYTAKGGIDVFYDSVEKKLVFQKKWYSTNAYGVQSANYVASTAITLKKVAKLISAIEDAQNLANSQLQ